MLWLLLIGAAVILLKKGASVPALEEAPPDAPCTRTSRDGPFTICIYPGPGTRHRWRAESDGKYVTGETKDYVSDTDALVAAWRVLAGTDIMSTVIDKVSATSNGLTLHNDGRLVIADQAKYVNWASPLISKATMDGDDAGGIVLAVLMGGMFGAVGTNWNPFRVKIAGAGFDQAVERVAAVQPPNPPQVARALMGI